MEDNKDINRILELIPQPVFCVQDGRILYRNHAAAQLFLEPGLPVAELLGEAAEDYLHFQGSALYLQLLLPGAQIGASVTRLDSMDIFVAEQDQSELRAMALAALQFREPLADVLSILNRTSEGVDASQLGHLNRRLFQMQRLVFNMADAARYSAETDGRKECMDICSLVRELFSRIEVLTASSGVTLLYSCPQEPVITMLNPEKLERAVYNLISNAMKVTPKGGTIEGKLTYTNGRLYLSVRDYGTGIPENIRSTVYTRYLRHPGLDDSQEGLGLGMTLIRTAATDHGGAVLINHPEGGGTRVTMTLSVLRNQDPILRSNLFTIDYAGEQDHGLLELSDILPPTLYAKDT